MDTVMYKAQLKVFFIQLVSLLVIKILLLPLFLSYVFLESTAKEYSLFILVLFLLSAVMISALSAKKEKVSEEAFSGMINFGAVSVATIFLVLLGIANDSLSPEELKRCLLVLFGVWIVFAISTKKRWNDNVSVSVLSLLIHTTATIFFTVLIILI